MDPTDHRSAELVVRSNDSGEFTQSGQLDWVGFLRGTAEASISILTRLSGSGVEPLTIVVAQKLCSPLRLSGDGQRRVTEALSFLKSFSSFGDVLWFGFGIRHVVRSLATSREGLGCVALCAALAETHSADVAALTLSNYADLTAAPREITPSIAQWKRLVQTCSGALAQSDFGDVVREFTQPARLHNTFVEASDPQALAEALRYLAMVTSGRLDSIAFTGGAECGWVGAVSYWLLGLSVSIQTGEGPITFYNSSLKDGSKHAQVRIIYDHSIENHFEARSMVVKKSHRLNSLSELIRDQLAPGSATLRLQVPWESVLTDTFGSKPISILTQGLPTLFVTAVGSVASLFEAVATAREDVDPPALLRQNSEYLEGTYGRGFVYTMWNRFQELPKARQSEAIDHLEPKFNEARTTYERALLQISNACECDRHGNGKASICSVAFLETIVYLARALPGFIVDERIRPSMNGIYGIYELMKSRLGLDPVDRLLHHTYENSLTRATRVFGGVSPSMIRQGQSEAISATAGNGLCCYLDSLCCLSDSAENLSRVHIVPGCIQLDNRTFIEVRDSAFEAPRYKAISSDLVKTIDYPTSALPDNLKVEAVATEAESYVSFSWKITTPQLETCWIPAAQLAAAAIAYQGRVSCRSHDCLKMNKISEILVVTGEGAYDPIEASSGTIRFVPKTGPAWCVSLMSGVFSGRRTAFMSFGGYNPSYSIDHKPIILQKGECLDCCVKALMKLSGGEVIYRI